MEHHDGFWWPDRSRVEIRELVMDTTDDAQAAVDLTPHRGVVIQAGANVGCWPKWLSKRFSQVYTFEPEANNFAALEKNVVESNIQMFHAALGERAGVTGLRISPKNIGAHRMEGPGKIPVMTIDQLYLKADAIILDVEGFEFPVLRGGVRTISRHHPTIMVEDRGLGRKRERLADIARWLEPMGYKERARVNYDVIFR